MSSLSVSLELYTPDPSLAPPPTVLSSSALLVSDRPVAELVAQGCASSGSLHPKSCTPSWCGGKKARKRLGGGRPQRVLGHAERRLLVRLSPEEREQAEAEEQRLAVDEDDEGATDRELMEEVVAVPSAFFHTGRR